MSYPPPNRHADSLVAKIRQAYQDQEVKNKAEIGLRFDLSRSTVFNILSRPFNGEPPLVGPKAGLPTEAAGGRRDGQESWKESDREACFDGVSDKRIKTLADAVAFAGADMDVWEVKEWECTSWEVGMRLKHAGPDGSDAPHVQQLWRVKVRFRRILARSHAAALERVVRRLRSDIPAAPAAQPRPVGSPPRAGGKRPEYMLEIDLFDVHFGKLAWGPETGGQHYDLKIAERVFRDAVDELLGHAAGRNVSAVLFPVGNDFLHFDNLSGTTTAGTPQDRDGRLSKVFETASLATVWAVERAREVADVQVLYVPGNHDRTISYFLCQVLAARFHDNNSVIVDTSPTLRKYHQFGNSLIGFTHGNEERHASLPAIMATERRAEWAATGHHEWHVGHYHKPKQTEYLSVDSHDGVTVRFLRSLSASDSWHYSRGYLSTQRAAEGFLWDRDRGLSANFVAWSSR